MACAGGCNLSMGAAVAVRYTKKLGGDTNPADLLTAAREPFRALHCRTNRLVSANPLVL